MSSSVFKEFPQSHNNDKSDSNLVIVVNKDGSVSVDQSTLHEFLANKETTNTSVSIVRVTSPTPSITEEIELDEQLEEEEKLLQKQKKQQLLKDNEESQIDDGDEMLELLSNSNISVRSTDEQTPHVSLTVENFYPPEEARKFAVELLNFAGVDNPLTIKTYEHARYIVFNDHCYAQLRINKTETSKGQSKLEILQNKKNLVQKSGQQTATTTAKQRLQKQQQLIEHQLQDKELEQSQLNDSIDSISEENNDNSDQQDDSDTNDTTDFSEISENDRDSDLDFNINDRNSSAKIKTKLRKRKRRRQRLQQQQLNSSTKLIGKKRQTSTSMLHSAVDKEMENMFSEEIDTSREDSQKGSAKKLSSKTPKKNTTVNKIATTSTPISTITPKKNVIGRPRIHSITNPPVKVVVEQQPIINASPQIPQTQEISGNIEIEESLDKQQQKYLLNKKKQTPSHVEALFTDMSSLFSTPDIIKKVGGTSGVVVSVSNDSGSGFMTIAPSQSKVNKIQSQPVENHTGSTTGIVPPPTVTTVGAIQTAPRNDYEMEQDKQLDLIDSIVKQELQETNQIKLSPLNEDIPNIVKMLQNSVGGHETATVTKNVQPASTHSLINSLQDTSNTTVGGNHNLEDDLLPDDLLIAELVTNKNLQEIIDVVQQQQEQQQIQLSSELGPPPLIQLPTVITVPPAQQINNIKPIISNKMVGKEIQSTARKEPIQIVRSDGRVITLPPIEAPTTRGAKRRAQVPNATTPSPSAAAARQASTSTTVITPNSGILNDSSYLYGQSSQLSETNSMDASFNFESQSSGSGKDSRRSSTNSTKMVTQQVSLNNDSESDASANSEDDPNRIWCLCKRPHNNRFMICCDSCLDWFHGKCVNITKVMGQQMEEKGIEWTCPNCLKMRNEGTGGGVAGSGGGDNVTIEPMLSYLDTSIKPNFTSNSLSTLARKPQALITQETSTVGSCIVCKNPARQSSIYCSDDCIRKHAQNALVTSKTMTTINLSNPGPTTPVQSITTVKSKPIESPDQQTTAGVGILKNKSDRVIVLERRTGRCLAGNSAPTVGNLKQWLQDNPTFEVVQPGSVQAQAIKAKQLQLRQLSKTMLKQKPATPPDNKIQTQLKIGQQKQIIVFNPQKADGKVTPTTSLSSSTANLVKIVKQNQLGQGTTKQTTITPQGGVNRNVTVKSVPVSSAMTKDSKTVIPTNATTVKVNNRKQVMPTIIYPKEREVEPIRLNIRKTLKEHLSTRMNEVQTGPKLTAEEMDNFALVTETEMFILFNRDTGTKYKAKYRSLMFNIKDRKNTTLFQKICDKSIEPKQLVKMSPEELASQELAQWRENENKHQLEMIKKSELDLLACAKNYVLKTHKGEEVIESKLSDRVELDPTIAVEDVVSLLNNSTVSSTSDTFSPTITTKERLDKFEKLNRELDIQSTVKLTTTSSLSAANNSSLSSTNKKKESRRSRSRSREKDRDRKHSSSSKYKRKRSRDKRSRSREKDGKRSRSRDESKEQSSRRRSDSRNVKKDDRRDKKEITTTAYKSNVKVDKDRKTVESKPNKVKVVQPMSSIINNEYNLVDKILEASSTATLTPGVVLPTPTVVPVPGPLPPPPSSLIPTTIIPNMVSPSVNNIETNLDALKKTTSIESDQEPSSTVTIPTPPDNLFDSCSESNDNQTLNNTLTPPTSTTTPILNKQQQTDIWSGTINMIDVSTFQITGQTVSGDCDLIKHDLPLTLDVVGRISPDTVWDYIMKIKKSPNKEILLIRFGSINSNEKSSYYSLYTYLDSRKRLGVIKTSSPYVKDFYILPLGSGQQLPSVLLPITRPGFIEGDQKPDLLIGVIVKIKGKRSAAPVVSNTSGVTSGGGGGTVNSGTPAKIARKSSQSGVGDGRYTPPNSPKEIKKTKLTSGLPKHGPETSSILLGKTSSKSSKDDEPYSPGGSDDELSAIPTTPTLNNKTSQQDEIQRKMDEINRQIAAKSMEIAGIINTNINQSGMDEPYSPSRPVTPTIPTLANIAIPSNLQEILASITKSSTSTTTMSEDVDSVSKPSKSTLSSTPPPSDLPATLPGLTLLTGEKDDARVEDEDEYVPSSITTASNSYTPAAYHYKQVAIGSSSSASSSGPSKLAQLSDAELMSMVPDDIVLEDLNKKSMEQSMDVDDGDGDKEKIDDSKNIKWDNAEPPPPGLEDEYEPL